MTIDEDRLIGSCVLLPGHSDIARMRAQLASIPAGYRAEDQSGAVAVFLKGEPPVRFKPGEDRLVPGKLPYLRRIKYEQKWPPVSGQPCYRQREESAMAARLKLKSLRITRGGSRPFGGRWYMCVCNDPF